LEKYGKGLSDKKETVILTKTDLVDEKTIAKAKKALGKYNKDILETTVLDDAAVKKLSDEITAKLR
jgi:ethanolamine utilization protein EutP (predicted NTPase)